MPLVPIRHQKGGLVASVRHRVKISSEQTGLTNLYDCGPQAGIAMGLAKGVAARFPVWGPDFATLMVNFGRLLFAFMSGLRIGRFCGLT